MQDRVFEEMNRMVDRHFHVPDLNKTLKICILDKSEEQSIWADITIFSHLMLGGKSTEIYRAGAAMELIILSLDILDDLQDRDNMEKPWMKFPQEFTLNAVIAFLMAAIHEISSIIELTKEKGNLFVSTVSERILLSINGQQRDISDSVTSEAEYVVMVQEKSGSLLRLACYLGYSCLDALSVEISESMDELAKDIGMIAQIDNDLKDLLRFDLKNDLLQKKRTLPILFLLAEEEDDFPYIRQYYAGSLEKEGILRLKMECMQYFHDSGCIEYSKIIQTLYLDHAEKIFECMDTFSPWKEKFLEITLNPFK